MSISAPPTPHASGQDAAGLEALVALHREGRLAEEYRQVSALVSQLDADGLVRAGQLLARLDPDELLGRHGTWLRKVTVAVTGHGTLSPLIPPLTAEVARHGLVLNPVVADFDSYVADLSDPTSRVNRSGAELVLCLLDPMLVMDELPLPWRSDDVGAVWERLLARLEGLVAERAAGGLLVLNTIPLPQQVRAQVTDHVGRARLGALWREANARLLRLTETHPSLVVVDLDALMTGGTQLTDPRLDVYAKVHLGPALLGRYAREIGHLARNLAGATKKCLVLDLDGTLWGGVLGDDGPDGIEVADTYRGEAFRGFQRVVKQLGSQGVVLAVVSKNDGDRVREAFATNPRLTLREDDFVRVVANWRSKSDNLAALAADLNLGADSLVFVDDNSFECGLVRHALPSVTVVAVDDEPALHVQALLRDGWFDTRETTEEDRRRAVGYQQELARRADLDAAGSLEEYLRHLGVRVRLAPVTPSDVPRVSQLTLRTNQFNLTTRRLQPGEVAALAANPDAEVLAVHAADRYGDNGIVGALVLHRAGDRVVIDNFVLSCRSFSRNIEHATVGAVLRLVAARGAAEVRGSYSRTAKNGRVSGFYEECGFTRVSGDEDAGEFRHDLADLPPIPEHVQISYERTPE